MEQMNKKPLSINYENNFMVTLVEVVIGLRDDIISDEFDCKCTFVLVYADDGIYRKTILSIVNVVWVDLNS